jgi:hypothetical protein
LFRVTDGAYGDAKKSTDYTLTLNVDRNRNSPEWLSTFTAPIRIPESLDLSNPVAFINIRDLDLSVSWVLLISVK